MSEQEILQHILNVWQTHNKINLLLIRSIPAKGFSAVPLASKGRTVAEQLEHMNRVRQGWTYYHRTGKRPSSSQIKTASLTSASLKRAFTASGKEVEKFLTDALNGTAKLRAFKNNPLRFMGYLISHESHHRGSMMLALKQNGIKLPEKISLQGMWGRWMWGE